MTVKEKTLYHQIHPAKLATDSSAAIISLYYFWQHHLALALGFHFLPPIIASYIIIKYVSVETQKKSGFGRYIKNHMSHKMEGLRFSGDIIMVIAAWYHSGTGIFFGLMVVLFAWLKGAIAAEM